MKIYIVILHYGRLETTLHCLNSLREHDGHFHEIVLINNDEKITLAYSQFSLPKQKLHIINNKKNLGFAAGVNIGIRYALQEKADAIFLLNNDTLISKDFLKKLSTVMEQNEDIGIVGPAIRFHRDDKEIYDLGGKVNMFFGRTSHDEIVGANLSVRPDAQIVTYISGCCMLIKQDVFDAVGFFDEQYFLYYEDADFCLRARQKGFLSAVLPTVSIYHELSKSKGNISPFSVYYQTKSGVVFGKKWCKIRLLNLAFLFAQSCLFLLKDRKAGAAAFKGLVGLSLLHP